ncbi:AIPR family protein [Fusobacterium sp.]|uniref:AIPR family protein n=1 Tax=Fusobacterium sp. TaxID=68766 RepID=UPI000E81D96E|nr:AIPR family protein [Fusobacterium sp.]HBJ80199.1 hypothetical protein [Fusobacterium sp.]
MVENMKENFLEKAKKYFGEGKTNEIYYLNTILCKKHNFSIEELSNEKLNFDGKWDSKIDHLVISINNKAYNTLDEIEEILNSNEKMNEVEVFIFQLKDRDKNSFSTNEALLMRSTIKDMIMLEKSQIEKMPYNVQICHLAELLKKICNSCFGYIKMNVYYIVSHFGTQSQTKNEVVNIGIVLGDEITNKKRIEVNFEAIDLVEIVENINYLIENNKKYYIKFKNENIIKTKEGFIGVFSLKEYYDFLSTKSSNYFDKNLAEGNVRYFLGENTEVNIEIVESLNKIKTTPDTIDFLQKNNGTTIIVDDYNIDKDNNKILFLSPKIVNGLQTSNSIFNTLVKEENLSAFEKHNILLKVIKTSEIENIKEISWGSNNQNQITKENLKSLDQIHQNLKKRFKDKDYIYFIKNNIENKSITNEIYMTDIAKAYFIFELKNTRDPKTKGDRILNKENYDKVFNVVNEKKLIEYTIFYKKMLDFLEAKKENIFKNQDNSLIKYITILSITCLTIKEINLENITKLSNEITMEKFENKFEEFSKLIQKYCEEKQIENDISRKSKNKILNEDFFNWLNVEIAKISKISKK